MRLPKLFVRRRDVEYWVGFSFQELWDTYHFCVRAGKPDDAKFFKKVIERKKELENE